MKILKNPFIVIIGPSGIGKGTLVKLLLEKYNFFTYLPSETSRPMRDSESQGNPYFFISDEEFKKRINEKIYLEYDFHHESYYGTNLGKLISLLSSSPVLKEMDMNGVEKIKTNNYDYKYNSSENTLIVNFMGDCVCFKIFFIGIIGNSYNQANSQREIRDKGNTKALNDRVMRVEKEEKYSKDNTDFCVINPFNNINQGFLNLSKVIEKLILIK